MRYANRGFTLIELLVVITIIAILAAILFPVFARTKEKAKQTACLSNMKQLGQAFNMYRNDYDGFMPYMALVGWDNYSGSWVYYRWVHAIFEYVMNNDIYACPSQPVFVDANSRPTLNSPLPETSYFYCSYYMTDLAETNVKDVSKTIILMDGWYFRYGGGTNGVNYPMFWANLADAQYMADWVNWRITPYYVDSIILDAMHRHNGRVNVSYYDGHCKSVKSARPQDFTPALD